VGILLNVWFNQLQKSPEYSESRIASRIFKNQEYSEHSEAYFKNQEDSEHLEGNFKDQIIENKSTKNFKSTARGS